MRTTGLALGRKTGVIMDIKRLVLNYSGARVVLPLFIGLILLVLVVPIIWTTY